MSLCVTCHMTHIMCHMSNVTCHLSPTSNMLHVPCNFFWEAGGREKLIHLVDRGSVIHTPHPTPHLVLIQITIVVYCNSFDSVENLKSATYFRFTKISNFYIFEICTFIIHTIAIAPFRQANKGYHKVIKFSVRVCNQ